MGGDGGVDQAAVGLAEAPDPASEVALPVVPSDDVEGDPDDPLFVYVAGSEDPELPGEPSLTGTSVVASVGGVGGLPLDGAAGS